MTVFRRSCGLVLLLLVLAPSFARAERVPVTIYSIREGLAHFAVNRIVRDSRGFMWICTREGLSMFDGYGFTTFRTSDGLPSSHVTDILETPDGLYWIGTLDGLVRFDPAAALAARFTRIALPGNQRTASITSVVRDRAGTIWAGTAAGLLRIDPAASGTGVATAVDLGIPDRLTARYVHALLVDRRGSLWIAARGGLLVRRPDGALTRLASYGVPLLEDRDGGIWVATAEGLWQFTSGRDGVPRAERRLYKALPELWVRSLFQASDGSMWASTFSGVWRVHDLQDPRTVRFSPVTDQRGVPISVASTLAEDFSGHLWIGTNLSGALRLPRAGFTAVAEGGPKLASAITQTRAGEVAFIGSLWTDWAIYCSDGKNTRAVKPAGPVGSASWAWNQVLFEDSAGDWWIGTATGAFRYAGARRCVDLDGRAPAQHFDSRSGLAADVAIRLFEDSRRDVWIATVGHGVRADGLSRWIRSTGGLQKYGSDDGLPSFEQHYVSSFAEDKTRQLWIGFSGNAGLARLRNGRFEVFTREHGLPGGQVRDLVIDESGRLWIASFRGGLVLVQDPAAPTPRFRTYTTTDGLSSNEVYAVVPDQAGRVYVASAGGIDRLHPESGVDRRYAQADGLPAGEVNAGLRDSSGTLWFTQTTGAVRFTPAERGAAAPRILITRLAAGGQPQPVSAVGQNSIAPFTLPHDRNSVEISFVALGGAASDYRYRYRLENAGSEWSPFSDTRTIAFANLAPKSYRLLVEARDALGRVTEQPAVVAFTIVPPFWQRGSFITLMLLVAGAGAYGLHRYRLRQVLAIARIRDRIATDLHDDLGANLTKIAVLGEVARQQGPRREGALASIAGIARESIANMGDIIWAIDPERDTMDDVVRKMRQHASETFADGETALTFRAPSTLDGRPVHIELRHDLFLLFKEAINNIARHARCRRVDVGLDVAGETLRLRVTDDGVGFDPDAASDGRGTGSMRKRAARMGGRLDIASVPGRGTTLELNVPLW